MIRSDFPETWVNKEITRNSFYKWMRPVIAIGMYGYNLSTKKVIL
jgi:hypothetical protein